MSKQAFLILEDGVSFEGISFGYEKESMGEVVFNTSMSGYQEVLTDPSYNGQIITMTYPMIGNYGVNEEDVESENIQVSGFVVQEYSKRFSNYRANESLSEYLKRTYIAAIEGVDTRKLTRHIRDKGALRGGIFFNRIGAVEKLLAHPRMAGSDLATQASCKEPYRFGKIEKGYPEIAVFDFGIKLNILRLLNDSGFSIIVYPGNTTLREILANNNNLKGVFLSNGPGDPDAVPYGKDLIQEIIREGIPAMGICLGHQIISLGLGGSTYKLKFGHRGANQPVKNLLTGRVEITSQNHGFAVASESMDSIDGVEITHINLNDNTVEGLRHNRLKVFSVQYHPEASPGPHDSAYLFKQFFKMVVE